MANAAILIGNSEYKHQQRLDCCGNDLSAMKELLEATQKYDTITTIANADADSLKQQLRTAIDKVAAPNELFFYFTGHGTRMKASCSFARQTSLRHSRTKLGCRQPSYTPFFALQALDWW